jgi:hypothetical protein
MAFAARPPNPWQNPTSITSHDDCSADDFRPPTVAPDASRWSGVAPGTARLLGLSACMKFRQEPQLAHVLDLLASSRALALETARAASSSRRERVGTGNTVDCRGPSREANAHRVTAAESPRAAADRFSDRCPMPRTLETRIQSDGANRRRSPDCSSAATRPCPAPSARSAATCHARPGEPARGLRWTYPVLAVPLHATQCSQRQWASHAQCERFRATDSVD